MAHSDPGEPIASLGRASGGRALAVSALFLRTAGRCGCSTQSWGPWAWRSSTTTTSVILYGKPDPLGRLLIQRGQSTQGTGGSASGTFCANFMVSSGFGGSGAAALWQASTLLPKEGLTSGETRSFGHLDPDPPILSCSHRRLLLTVANNRSQTHVPSFFVVGKICKFRNPHSHTHTLPLSLSAAPLVVSNSTKALSSLSLRPDSHAS